MDTGHELDREHQAYKKAEKRAEELQGFYIHALIYIVVNAGLFTINALTRGDSGNWWFYWPLAGWGVGVAIHALATFGGVFGDDWKERKAAQLYERSQRAGR